MQNNCLPDNTPDWPKLPVSALAEQNPRYPVKKGVEYPFIEMASVGENFGGILKLDYRRMEGSGLSRFKINDTLFAKITPCPENGKVAFVSALPADVGLGSTEFIVLSPRDGTDPRFLYHLLCTYAVRGRATARMEGSTGRQRVPSDVFERHLLVPKPCKNEQAAIARVLDAVDAALDKVHVAIDQATLFTRSLSLELLECGLDESGSIRSRESSPSSFKTTELGLLPYSWEVQKLADIADVERGKFSPRPRNDPRYYNGPFPFVQTGQITKAKGRVITEYSQTLNEQGKAVSREFPPGTIMVTIAANIGETAILGKPMCAPDSLVGVVVRPPHSPRFIELWLAILDAAV